MFSSQARPLSFPLDRSVELTVLTPPGEEVCGLPAFPEDSDERITVLFDLSLNEFVALASAIDAGIDLAFAEDAQKVWWIWIRSVMCASFCQQMADCLTNENPAVVDALAALIANNATIRAALSAAISELGSAIPGQPLTDSQAAADFLPGNVKDEEGNCDYNALWGACLFLVQSGNRAITDFFEIVEEQTNALETSAIVVGAIPAAGDFAEAGLEFADQLLENISEGYAAAYTEEYETQLACEIFCTARAADCELTADMLVDMLHMRLGFPEPGDFGDVMSGIGGAIYPGTNIADSAFYIYFTALRYGQKFLDVIGFRPLTDLMSLGADQLGSDNWETLCDCPECGITGTITIGTAGMDGDIVSAATALVSRLDITGSAYARRIEYEFDTPVVEITLGWNTEGALDDMFAQLAGNATQTLPAPAGSTTLIFSTPGTTFIVDLGYAGDSGAYSGNPARINITDACT